MRKLMNGCTMALCGWMMLFGAVRAQAAFSRNDAGTATAQFLKLGAGARATGMGEASTAVSDDATAIYWNPAGLTSVEGQSLSVMHAVWFEDIVYDWASYARSIRGVGVVGLAVQYLSYGSLNGFDGTGIEQSNFSPSDLAVSLSFARRIRAVDIGVNAKYISSTIKDSASAYAFDCGARYQLLDERLSFGAAVQNLGTSMKFDREEDPLPSTVRIGGAYRIIENWLAAVDVIAPVDNEPGYGLGTEYIHKINASLTAVGRLGYCTRNKDTGGLNGLTAGAGISYLNYAIDYAFVPYGDLGTTNRISVGIKF